MKYFYDDPCCYDWFCYYGGNVALKWLDLLPFSSFPILQDICYFSLCNVLWKQTNALRTFSSIQHIKNPWFSSTDSLSLAQTLPYSVFFTFIISFSFFILIRHTHSMYKCYNRYKRVLLTIVLCQGSYFCLLFLRFIILMRYTARIYIA